MASDTQPDAKQLVLNFLFIEERKFVNHHVWGHYFKAVNTTDLAASIKIYIFSNYESFTFPSHISHTRVKPPVGKSEYDDYKTTDL